MTPFSFFKETSNTHTPPTLSLRFYLFQLAQMAVFVCGTPARDHDLVTVTCCVRSQWLQLLLQWNTTGHVSVTSWPRLCFLPFSMWLQEHFRSWVFCPPELVYLILQSEICPGRFILKIGKWILYAISMSSFWPAWAALCWLTQDARGIRQN